TAVRHGTRLGLATLGAACRGDGIDQDRPPGGPEPPPGPRSDRATPCGGIRRKTSGDRCMNSTRTFLATLAGALVLAGCAYTAPPGSGDYYGYQAMGEQSVRFGVVDSIRPVRINPGDTGVGTATGAVLGGLAGSQVGGCTGQIAGAVGGALLGGLIGS